MRRVAAISAGPRSARPRGSRAFSLLGLSAMRSLRGRFWQDLSASCPALCRASTSCFLHSSKTWMAGTSPAMTDRERWRGSSHPRFCHYPRNRIILGVDQAGERRAMAQAPRAAQKSSVTAAVPNDLEAFFMPFTANRAFKARPRLIARAKDMHYYTPEGRAVLDGAAGLWCTNAGHNRSPI